VLQIIELYLTKLLACFSINKISSYFIHAFDLTNLSVEGELIQLKFLVELAGHTPSFEDVRLHVGIEHDRVPDVLLQLSGTVVDVQVGIPVSRPVDLLEILRTEQSPTKRSVLYVRHTCDIIKITFLVDFVYRLPDFTRSISMAFWILTE